jgi:hypothetical protein
MVASSSDGGPAARRASHPSACAVVADDWGWWRTLTGTVEHIRDLADARHGDLLPPGANHDVFGGLHLIQEAADTVPKTLRGLKLDDDFEKST